MGATTLKTRIHTAALVAATVMAMGVLTACSGQSAPIVTTTPSPSAAPTAMTSPSPSSSPSASPTPLTDAEVLERIPEQAREETFSAAFAFATFFLREYRTIASENPALLDALMDDNCNFCNSVTTAYADLHELGQTTRGGAVRWAGDAPFGGLQEDGSWALRFSVDVDDVSIIDANGKTVETVPGGPGVNSIKLAWVGRWIVLEVAAERKQ